MSAAAATQNTTVPPVPPAVSLASLYDIQDPDFQYTVPDPKPKPASPAPPPAASSSTAPASQPVQPSTPVNGQPGGVTPAPTASPAPSTKPTWLLQNATDLGIHPILIERSSVEELNQIVMQDLMRYRQSNNFNSQAAAHQQQPGQHQQQVPQQQPAAAVAPQQQQPPPKPAFDWGEHDYTDENGRTFKKKYEDGDINAALGFHVKRLSDEVTALRREILAIHERAAQGQHNALASKFDAAFNKLGGIFGQGTVHSMSTDPAAADFRQKRGIVFAAVQAMQKMLPPEVQRTMSVETAVFNMAKSMFGVDAPAAAVTPQQQPQNQGNGQPTPQQFQTGGVNPPTNRRGSEVRTGVDFAKSEVDRWFQEQQAAGQWNPSGGTSMDEFLPL